MLHCSWQVPPGSVQGDLLLRVAGAPNKAMPLSLLPAYRWPARSASVEPKHTLCQAVRGQGPPRQAV